MPVIIQELVVVAQVTDGRYQSPGTGPGNNNNVSPATALDENTRMQLVSETVQQVLAILERKKDR